MAMKFRSLKGREFVATRVRLGLSQRQLADQLGISKAAVAMAETGQRKLPVAALIKMAALEIKMSAAAIPGTVTKQEGSNTDVSTTQNL
jgi:transcriptional regulator with XRE-family HTH domain